MISKSNIETNLFKQGNDNENKKYLVTIYWDFNMNSWNFNVDYMLSSFILGSML